MEQDLKPFVSPSYNIFHFVLVNRKHLLERFIDVKIEEIEIDMFDPTHEIFHSNLGQQSNKTLIDLYQEMDLIIFVEGDKIKTLKSRFGKQNHDDYSIRPSFL